MRLTPEEVVALDMHAPKGVSEYRRLAKRDAENPPNLADNQSVYFCGGGMNSFAINAYGEMGICVISQQETFSVAGVELKQVWEGYLEEVRRRKRTRVTKCTQCRIQSLCGMCPANGELENGDRESPVAFLCNVAHLRAAVIGAEIPAHGDCEFCAGGSEHRGSVGVGAPDHEQGNRCGELGRAAADSADSEQLKCRHRGMRELRASLSGQTAGG